MKKILVLAAMMAVGFATLGTNDTNASLVTIANWTFETSIPTTAGPHAAEIGSGLATGSRASGTTAYSNPVGNGSLESFSSNNWTTIGDYYQFSFSTAGLSGVQFSFDQTRSSTGPSAFNLLYSTDGTNFSQFANYTVNQVSWSSGTPASGSSFAFDLSSVAAINNQSSVFIRLAITATAVNTGTNRIDNVVAAAVPEPSALLLVGSVLGAGFLRRRRS